MRPLPAPLQAALDGGCTPLCLCWKLVPRGRAPMGFTNHDRDIAFDGVVFRASSGLSASEAETLAGLSTAVTEVAGALSSDAISEDDLAAGVYDDAAMEVWLVDWRAPQDRQRRHLLHAGSIGRVRRGEVHFEAELRAPSHPLEQPSGRLFSRGCDAIVGDARCGVDLTTPRHLGQGRVVASAGPAAFSATGLEGHAPGWFTHGRLQWTSGANAGREALVRAHRLQGAVARIELSAAMPQAPSTGDAFTVTAGCDRTFTTCREKFANAVNYRGFPHMPGNDFAMGYPNHDDGDHDGAPLLD